MFAMDFVGADFMSFHRNVVLSAIKVEALLFFAVFFFRSHSFSRYCFFSISLPFVVLLLLLVPVFIHISLSLCLCLSRARFSFFLLANRMEIGDVENFIGTHKCRFVSVMQR